MTGPIKPAERGGRCGIIFKIQSISFARLGKLIQAGQFVFYATFHHESSASMVNYALVVNRVAGARNRQAH